MRKAIFWLGWTILFLIPVAFVAEVLIIQDMPPFPMWKYAVPVVGIALIYLARNHDDVLHHHLV